MTRAARCSGRWLALAVLGSALQGCAIWAPVAVEPPAAPSSLESGLDAGVEDAIAQAMPDVSYESENPAMSDPLGREDVTVILPPIETQEGEARIVCRKTNRHVFGRCAFPVTPAP